MASCMDLITNTAEGVADGADETRLFTLAATPHSGFLGGYTTAKTLKLQDEFATNKTNATLTLQHVN